VFRVQERKAGNASVQEFSVQSSGKKSR